MKLITLQQIQKSLNSVKVLIGEVLTTTVDALMELESKITPDTWKKNTANSEGYVDKGEGQINKVWGTDAEGNPGWRDETAASSSVTGVKGNAESEYRHGNVDISPENIGALPLIGGIMTGDIQQKRGDYIAIPIRLYEYDKNGVGMTIQSGGLTIIGGGESATNLRKQIVETDGSYNDGSEQIYVTSDQAIHLVTACQTIDNRKEVLIDTSGNITVPGKVTASSFSGGNIVPLIYSTSEPSNNLITNMVWIG